MTNLTRNEILYFMYACFHVIEVYITNTAYHNNMNCSPKNERSGYKRSTMQQKTKQKQHNIYKSTKTMIN